MSEKTRREFIRSLLEGAVGGMFLFMIPKPAYAQRIHQITKDGETPEWFDHYWAYIIDIGKCIGCGACVRADKRENDVPREFFRTWVERYQVTGNDHVHIDSPDGGYNGFAPRKVGSHLIARVQGMEDPVLEKQGKAREDVVTKGFFVPKMCMHCRNTPCVQVCPVNASYQSPQGVVLVDKKRCIGCAYCVQACPYGSRYIDPRTHTADKCTWCFHRITRGLQPACVSVCPTGARKFGDLRDETSEVKKLLETALTNVLKPELNTEPFCFYIGLDRAVR